MKNFTKSLFAAVMFLAGVSTASAQVDNTFRFVDNKTGEEIPDGGIYYAEAEEEYVIPSMPELGSKLEAKVDLSIENTSAAEAYVSAYIVTESMSSGKFQFCFPTNCLTYAPEMTSPSGGIVAGAKQPINTEWIPEKGKYGTAEFTIQLRLMAQNPLVPTEYSFVANGPKIIVKCNYADPAGINNAAAADKAIVKESYSIDGRRQVEPARGLNIVKMSDGTVRKVLAK